MPQLDSGGTQLHYQVLGRAAAAEPVVMLHGLLVGNLASWYFGAASGLAREREVVLYDLRGHGLSDQAGEGYDLDTMVRDLDAVVRSRGPGPVALVGHSYGGLVALHFALRHPERVSRLVVVEAPLPPSKSMQIDGFMGETPERIAEALPPELKAAVFAQKRQAKKFLERLQFLLCETELLDNLKREEDVPDELLRALRVPTLLVYGRASQLGDVGERLARVLPDARLEWLEGGHYLPSERPRELMAKIEEFFA